MIYHWCKRTSSLLSLARRWVHSSSGFLPITITMASIPRTSTALQFLAVSSLAWAAPNPRPDAQSLSLRDLGLPPVKRQDSDLAGYLGAFFLGDEPDVYFYLSNGNDAVSFSALNDGDAVIIPTTGTGGVRDPAIVPGGGDEAGQKWYIVGTDLDIAKVRSLCPWPPRIAVRDTR